MSEITRLAGAVRMLGESCASLAHPTRGAIASLEQAQRLLQGSKDTGDIAAALSSAATTWHSIEAATKGAAMDAYRFGSGLAT